MKNTMNATAWKALFQESGLNETAMQRWHQLFESRHPESHQSFLEWLGLSPKEIEHIRASSR